MLKIGIVGLPNVGKSTLFNALSGTNQAAASNFPFCTIEPNTGVVPVPDPRLDKLAEIEKSQKVVPATVEFVDIAGLVKGASQGQGLGNKFLSHIREVDAIIHVVRLFEDSNITHVTGAVSPKDDVETIELELMLADMDQADKLIDSVTKKTKSGDKDAKAQFDLLTRIKTQLEIEQPIRDLELTPDETKALKSFHFLSAKPVLYVVNLSEDQLGQTPELPGVPTDQTIGICAKIEAELATLSHDERAEYLTELGLKEPGLNRLIRAGYHLLGLITYFTAGEQEARGWTIPKGSTAPEAAGTIHTDFMKGFIRAETVAYDDFATLGGWTAARAVGKVRSEGKTYIVQDGDVMLFRHS